MEIATAALEQKKKTEIEPLNIKQKRANLSRINQ